MTVGERVREVRGIKTLEEFSRLLGVKGANISHIENNRSQMSLELAVKISEVYGVSLDWLLRGTGNKDGSPAKTDDPQENYVTISKDELLNLYKRLNQQQEEEIGKLQKLVELTKNIKGTVD